MSLINTLAHLAPTYLYLAIFIGHIFLGGFILVPALYLSIIGKVSFLVLLVLIVMSSMVGDSFWYFLGKRIGKNRIYALPIIRRRIGEAKKLSGFFDRYGVWTVFFTKFISGTRLASHILAGMHKVNYARFLVATGAGTSLWFIATFILIKWLDRGIAGMPAATFRIQVIAGATIFILVLMNWLTGTYLKDRLMHMRKKK